MQSEQFFSSSGSVISATDPAAIDTLFGYTGRAYDDATGLQNNLHRWYDAAVGRWASEDPIGIAAGDPNFYRYVGNGSTAATDPSGLMPPTDRISRRNLGGGYGNQLIQDGQRAAEVADELTNDGGYIDAVKLGVNTHLRQEFGPNTPADQAEDCRRQVNFIDRYEGNMLINMFITGVGAAASFRYGKGFLNRAQAAEEVANLRLQPLEQLSKEQHQLILRFTMDMPASTTGITRVAHHLIPTEAIKEFPGLMERALKGGFDINGCQNGFDIAAHLHKGPHKNYSTYVLNQLRRIYQNGELSDEEVANAIRKLAENRRRYVESLVAEDIPLN